MHVVRTLLFAKIQLSFLGCVILYYFVSTARIVRNFLRRMKPFFLSFFLSLFFFFFFFFLTKKLKNCYAFFYLFKLIYLTDLHFV